MLPPAHFFPRCEGHITRIVADDKPQWQNIIVGIFQADHDLVGVVERGDQVIEAAHRLCPDVITLDVAMPGPSGLNALPRFWGCIPNDNHHHR